MTLINRCKIGCFEDEYTLVFGIEGLAKTETQNCVLQVSKSSDDQDRQLGLVGLHFEMNNLSDYGLIQKVMLAGRNTLRILPTDERKFEEVICSLIDEISNEECIFLQRMLEIADVTIEIS